MTAPAVIVQPPRAVAPRSPVRRLPRQIPPVRVAETYFVQLRALVDQAFATVHSEIVPALPALADQAVRRDALRFDDWRDDLDRLIDHVLDRVSAFWPLKRLRDLLARIAAQGSAHQKGQLIVQIEAAFPGANVAALDPFRHEPWLAAKEAAWTKENIALIRSLPLEALDDVRERLVRSVRAGRRHEALAADIQEAHGVARRRAVLIARDQTQKWHASLNRARQQEIGVDSFTWRTAGDNRVCDDCEPLDGQVFRWGEAPNGDPGECHPDDRCAAEPILTDFWSRLGSGRMAA